MPTKGTTVWVFQGGQWVQGTVGTAAGTSGFWVTLSNGQRVSVSTSGQGTTWNSTPPSGTPTTPTSPTSGSPTPTPTSGSGYTPSSYTPPGTPGGQTSYPTAPPT